MKITKGNSMRICIVALGAVLLTALAIYITPLRHFVLIAPTMDEVDPKAVYTQMQKSPSDYLFIDVRDPGVYNSAHAVGAMNIPIAMLANAHFTLPKSGKKIVLICSTGMLATVAYGYLEEWGFQNLLHITGGLENWVLEGLPIEGANVVNGKDTVPIIPDGSK